MASNQANTKDSHRLQFRFWLDVTKPDEENLAETIETLKEKRGFAKAIRDGLRLLCDLKAGRWEVLGELFPWVVDAIYDAAQADILAQQPTVAKLDDAPVPDAIQAKLDRLEKLLLQQGAQPLEMPAFRKPTLPLLPEGDPAIEISAAQSDEKPAYNFMIANAKAGLMPLEHLPLEVLAYGVNKGKLPASVLGLKPQMASLPEPPVDEGDTRLIAVKEAKSSIKKMHVPTKLAAPRFDEPDDDLSLLS